jgi:uncharacterized membrane protein
MKKKRNRIVINLDAPPGSARAGRTGRGGIGRVLITIALVLLLLAGGLVAGGYFWWRSFKTSPAYTLAVLTDATQRKDMVTVDSILDTDKITDDFVAQVKQRTAGANLSSLWSSQLDSALPSMTPKLRETVHDEMVKELQHLTEPAAGKPLILVALVIGRFADIKQENNTATAQVHVQDEQLRLTMQSDAGKWRIIAVQDDKLAQQIAEGVMKNLPSKGGAHLQDEIRKQLEQMKPPLK